MRQSGLETFKVCPYQYKLRYLEEIETIPDQDPKNALIVGTALHLGCETGNLEGMLESYFNQYYMTTDEHINEAIKLEVLVPKVLKLLEGLHHVKYEHEVYFNINEFHGTADLLGFNEDGSINLYDFKYSNNVDRYMEKAQLHIYKHFLEQLGYKVNKMYFIFIPKTAIRQKKSESLQEFRIRLLELLGTMEPAMKEVVFDQAKVNESLELAKYIESCSEFPKTPNRLCDWCNYQKLCEQGADYMLIPENKRTEKRINMTPDLWIFGDSYSGKTTFADSLDDNLMLNTDGNVDTITSPVIRITDQVEVVGRKVNKTMAWQFFKNIIDELEQGTHTFKVITVDLVEDMWEHCRLWVYAENKWTHEQDGGYGKGYDVVALEFNSTMKRLKNVAPRIVLISKMTTSEITEKTGAKWTLTRPNLNPKFSNVLAGIVDMTIFIEADGDKREMILKPGQYIFGGGRTNFLVERIPLDRAAFEQAIQDAATGTKTVEAQEEAQEPKEEAQEEKTTSRRKK